MHTVQSGFLSSFATLAAMFCIGSLSADEGRTRNLILVTLDGVRVQEVFGGLDETVAEHDAEQVYSEIATMRERFGAESPQARRAALLPNFWNTLAPSGIVLGNPLHGNQVKVQNRILWSAPGYAELLTGRPQAEIVDNDNVRHPHRTALELAKEALRLEYHEVAEIGSWDGFKLSAASREDAFLMVGTYDSVPPPWGTPEIDQLAGLRREIMGLWEEGSNDALTWRIARAYLHKNRPRVMWLALVNSDDWAHADRYDRYLEYLHRADAQLGELWATLQAMDQYRDRTTLIITTDHGRGKQGGDWAEHDITIPGSEDIWLAVIGPDAPDIGEVTQPGLAYQGQVAATMLAALGLDPGLLGPESLPPVSGATVVVE